MLHHQLANLQVTPVLPINTVQPEMLTALFEPLTDDELHSANYRLVYAVVCLAES